MRGESHATDFRICSRMRHCASYGGGERTPQTAYRAGTHTAQTDAQEQDEFRSCDVAVRDFVQGQREATALPVKEVKVDGLRMTLNFVHPYGESGDTPPILPSRGGIG